MSQSDSPTPRKRVIVYHAGYGCDTGCCGHVVEMGDDEKFEFTHPYGITDEEELKQWARELIESTFGAEHVADLDWENSSVTDAC